MARCCYENHTHHAVPLGLRQIGMPELRNGVLQQGGHVRLQHRRGNRSTWSRELREASVRTNPSRGFHRSAMLDGEIQHKRYELRAIPKAGIRQQVNV